MLDVIFIKNLPRRPFLKYIHENQRHWAEYALYRRFSAADVTPDKREFSPDERYKPNGNLLLSKNRKKQWGCTQADEEPTH